MGRVINNQQFESVSALPAEERYGHFVRQVADWQEIWSLHGDIGWVLVADSNEREYIPVWPHARYAEAFATGSFAGTKPTAIPLDAWMARWLPGMVTDGRGVAVFPVAPSRGVLVSPDQLRIDLEAELENYE